MPLLDFNSIPPTVLTANADLLVATDRDDVIAALGGADTVLGLGGFDYINGNQGDDLLYGNAADDLILGGQGNDLMFGGQNADSLFGNLGDDFIFGNLGADTIWAGQDNDIVRAGKDSDWLLGERGRDILYGELGDDTLDGGADADTLEGGDGSDRFVLDTLTGSTTLADTDVIGDFTRTQDTLFVRDGLQYEQLTIAQGTGEYAGDAIVQVRETGQYLAILKGVTSTDIAIGDFTGLTPSSTDPGTGGITPGTGTGGTTPGTGTGGTPTPGSIAFAAATASIGENAGTATISVQRTGDTSQSSQIQYATSDGTAIAGSDYTAAIGTLNFAAGETAKTFTIAIRNDTTAESSETLQITLTDVVGATLGTQATMALTITDDDPISPPPTPAISAIDSSSAAKFTPSDTETTIAASGAQKIAIGTQTLYIGTWQKTGINQDPIVASFDSANPSNNWVKTNYEMTGADGRGYGLFWDGSNLYGVFSTDGTQGTASEDWRRVSSGATQSWLRSYGAGGGPKIAVIGKINLATGELLNAAYVSARRVDDGKTNSLAVTGLTLSNGNLQVTANSWWAPRNTDGSSMTQEGTGGSPHAYTLLLSPDLKTAIGAKATGWVSSNTTGLG